MQVDLTQFCFRIYVQCNDYRDSCYTVDIGVEYESSVCRMVLGTWRMCNCLEKTNQFVAVPAACRTDNMYYDIIKLCIHSTFSINGTLFIWIEEKDWYFELISIFCLASARTFFFFFFFSFGSFSLLFQYCLVLPNDYIVVDFLGNGRVDDSITIAVQHAYVSWCAGIFAFCCWI